MKQMVEVIYDEMEFEDYYEGEVEYLSLFDNNYQNKEYVVHGVLGLWDGKYEVFSNKIHNSLKDALYALGKWYIKVYEKPYGKLCANVCHHDGTDKFEIKELCPMGKELLDKGYDKNIFKRKGATKNIKFIKNYL